MGKWLEISELIRSELTGNTGLTDLLSDGVNSVYPVIAPQEEGEKFVNYEVSYEGNPTKDSSWAFSVTIRAFATTYNDAITIADAVIEVFAASSSNFRFTSGAPTMNEQEQFYIEQIFNIKK